MTWLGKRNFCPIHAKRISELTLYLIYCASFVLFVLNDFFIFSNSELEESLTCSSIRIKFVLAANSEAEAGKFGSKEECGANGLWPEFSGKTPLVLNTCSLL